MADEILDKMKRGVYYPGNYLGKKSDLENLVARGYLERMDSSLLYGPDSPPNYCLTGEGCLQK